MLSEIRLLPRFHELHKAIWIELRDEVFEGLRRSAPHELSRSGLLMLQILVAVVLIALWHFGAHRVGGRLVPVPEILLPTPGDRRAAGVDACLPDGTAKIVTCQESIDLRRLLVVSDPCFGKTVWQHLLITLTEGVLAVCHRRGCRRGVRLLVGAQPAAVGDL